MPTIQQFNSTTEQDLRACFSWLTRSGIGIKFGTRPIDWYQQHQWHAMEIIQKLCEDMDGSLKVRYSSGMVYAGNVLLGSVNELYEKVWGLV